MGTQFRTQQQQQHGQGPDDSTGEVEPVLEEAEYSYGNDFLKDIPDDVRSTLEPYIKKWDAGVTRRFQDLQSELSGYAPLKEAEIDSEDLEQLVGVYQLLNNDPKALIDLLTEALGEEVTPTVIEEPKGKETSTEIPSEVLTRLNSQEELLKLLANSVIEENNATKQQQEDAALESYIKLLKTEFGDFNEEYVVMKLSQGLDGDKAVAAWKEVVSGFVPATEQANAPKVLLGSGAPPGEQRSVKDLTRTETKELVVQMLANAQRSNNG